MLIQVILNGLALGAVYALIATGFSIIFNVLKFSNFAHGAMMTFSAFAGYYIAASRGLGLIATIISAIVVGAVIAVIGEFIAFRRITMRNTSPIYFFVSSITLGTLLEGIITIKVGANFYNYPRFFEKATLNIGNLIMSVSDLLMLIFSASALALLLFAIQKTSVGRALRAVSFDRDTAALMGINVFRIIQFTFLVSGALAGLAGVFLGINYTLYPALGSLVVKGFIASVIGGLGSLGGAIAGALLLGFVETILIHFVGSGYAPIFIFFIMLLFLLVRPQGISGSNVQEKA